MMVRKLSIFIVLEYQTNAMLSTGRKFVIEYKIIFLVLVMTKHINSWVSLRRFSQRNMRVFYNLKRKKFKIQSDQIADPYKTFFIFLLLK